jgi:signal peptidase I
MDETSVPQTSEQPLAGQEPIPPPPLPAIPAGALTLLRDITVSVILAVVLIVFIYQPVKVEGTSMMPGLTDNERIFINKYTYKLGAGAIARDDLVVFHYPNDPSQSYIKRVIGVPGDTIAIHQGVVYVNGQKLDEPYVPDEYRDSSEMKPLPIPPDDYFVLGDHRSSSNDSRVWGFVSRPAIYGKAVFVYWPLTRMGPVH